MIDVKEFKVFDNASFEVVSEITDTGPMGTEVVGEETVASGRCNPQPVSSLSYKEFQLLEKKSIEADIVIFTQGDLSGVTAGDLVTVEYDDGPTQSGTVQGDQFQTNSLLLKLNG